MLEQRVHDFLRPRTEPGDVLLAAVSGGPDSTALLHALLAVRDTLGVSVEAAHLDHRLRGAESEADARFVAGLAEEAGLTFHHQRADVEGVRREEGGSLEAVARRLRYAFLEEARRVAGARWIVTGHTLDDQAETLLMNLLRGAGPRGLGGMLPEGPGPICRPLLEVEKGRVLEYLRTRNLPYRVDPSNTDTAQTRNRVRRELVPLLKRSFGPAVHRVLAREAHLFAELDGYLGDQADALLKTCLLATGSEERAVEATSLSGAPLVVRRVAVRRILEDLIGDLHDFTYGHVEAVLHLAAGPAAGSEAVDLPRGIQVLREYDRLRFRRDPGPVRTPEPVTAAFPGTGEAAWGSWRVGWTLGPGPKNGADRAAGEEWFSAPELGSVLTLRGPLPGDRLAPLGLSGRARVSDLLIDRKVPREARATVLLLCDNGGPFGEERLLWVVGHRRSRHAPVTRESAQVVYFQAETTG